MLNPNETNVAQHYNHNGFEYESVRLQEYSPVEFAMTARYFNRWIPEQSTVVDIGVESVTMQNYLPNVVVCCT